MESITVGGDVVFVGFSVNGEVGSFVKSFDLAAGLFHGAKFGCVPGGRDGD